MEAFWLYLNLFILFFLPFFGHLSAQQHLPQPCQVAWRGTAGLRCQARLGPLKLWQGAAVTRAGTKYFHRRCPQQPRPLAHPPLSVRPWGRDQPLGSCPRAPSFALLRLSATSLPLLAIRHIPACPKYLPGVCRAGSVRQDGQDGAQGPRLVATSWFMWDNSHHLLWGLLGLASPWPCQPLAVPIPAGFGLGLLPPTGSAPPLSPYSFGE